MHNDTAPRPTMRDLHAHVRQLAREFEIGIGDLPALLASEQGMRRRVVGLADLTRGDQIAWDVPGAPGRTHQGTFQRIVGYGRRNRVEFLMVEVLKATGEPAHIDPEHANIRRSDGPTLPECATFAGAGQRCGSCRIHRKVHA